MHLMQEEVEAFTEEMDGAMSIGQITNPKDLQEQPFQLCFSILKNAK